MLTVDSSTSHSPSWVEEFSHKWTNPSRLGDDEIIKMMRRLASKGDILSYLSFFRLLPSPSISLLKEQ